MFSVRQKGDKIKRCGIGSKKKKRYQEYLKRQKKKEVEKSNQKILYDKNSTMKEMANALGIRLKWNLAK